MARDIDLGGLDNVFDNAARNIKEVFQQYGKDEAGVRFSRIYTEDEPNPRSHSLAIVLDNHEHQLRSWIGRQKRNFTIVMNFNIIYYHEQPENDARKKEVQKIIWGICQILLKHNTLNGFCDRLGSTVTGSEYVRRQINNNIMSAGLVRVTLRKLHTVTDID